MKKTIICALLLLSFSTASAQEFIVDIQPAPNSVGNPEVSSISSSKITDFFASVSSLITTALTDYLKKSDIVEPTVTKITTVGTSVYNTPAGVKYLRVKMVGGGSGGGGSGTSGYSNSLAGGASYFGSQSSPILMAEGGNPSGPSAYQPNGIINAPAYGFTVRGQSGEGYFYLSSTNVNGFGGQGGSSALGQGAARASNTSAAYDGISALANTGAGGSGGGGGSITGKYSGQGGGGAAYVEAIIPSPQSSYSVTVGAGSAGGAAGANGNKGGNGGSGIIIIEEHYQ